MATPTTRPSRLYSLLFVLLAALLMSACGANRQSALNTSDGDLLKATGQGDFNNALAAAKAAWDGRVDRAKLEESIQQWELAATLPSPDLSEEERRTKLAEIYTDISHAYYFLADTHVRFSISDEDERDEKMKEVHNKGITAAEKALAVHSPTFAKAMREKKPFSQAIATLDKNAVPSMYWYSTNMGRWALLEGFAEILSRKDDIKAMMDRVEAQGGTYFHGAPLRYFGVYYTKLPFPGGDPAKSQDYFEKAIRLSPGYLGNRVLMAEQLATKIGGKKGKKMFKFQLDLVTKFDVNSVPALKAENTFEQRKAKKLLANMDDLF